MRARFGEEGAKRGTPQVILDEARGAGIELNYGAVKRVPNTLNGHRLVDWVGPGTAATRVDGYAVSLLLLRRARSRGPRGACRCGRGGRRRSRCGAARCFAAIDGVDEVRALVQDAYDAGVTGVPCFVLPTGYAIPGAQSVETLDAIHRTSARTRTRTATGLTIKRRGKAMKGLQVIAEILKREGVEFIACYPHNDLIEACAQVGIRPIVCRQERVGHRDCRRLQPRHERQAHRRVRVPAGSRRGERVHRRGAGVHRQRADSGAARRRSDAAAGHLAGVQFVRQLRAHHEVACVRVRRQPHRADVASRVLPVAHRSRRPGVDRNRGRRDGGGTQRRTRLRAGERLAIGSGSSGGARSGRRAARGETAGRVRGAGRVVRARRAPNSCASPKCSTSRSRRRCPAKARSPNTHPLSLGASAITKPEHMMQFLNGGRCRVRHRHEFYAHDVRHERARHEGVDPGDEQRSRHQQGLSDPARARRRCEADARGVDRRTRPPRHQSRPRCGRRTCGGCEEGVPREVERRVHVGRSADQPVPHRRAI